MAPELRIVHYINQFFAGVGGEEKADTPPGVVEGPAGPARGLQQQLGGRGQIVATIFCGDNYFHQSQEDAKSLILEQVRGRKPQVLVAGPAFEAGRYGLACAEVCHAVAVALDIPCVLAMSPDNPAVVTYQSYKNLRVFSLPTTESAVGMADALARMARFIERLMSGVELGPAKEEGYIPRSVRRSGRAPKPGADRAVEMLLAKLRGNSFASEIPVERLTTVAPAAPIKDLLAAKIALVTTAGVVEEGNPERFHYRDRRWAKYDIQALRSMQERKWEIPHGGYNVVFVRDNANYAVPLDVLREMEDARVIGTLHSDYYVAVGGGTYERDTKIGQEIAEDLRSAGVDGVLLVST